MHHLLYFQTMRLGWNLRTAFTGLVHDKLLKVSSSTMQRIGSGKVINLISTDVLRFDQFSTCIHFGWMSILDVVVIAVLMCNQVGWQAGLSGIGVMMLSMVVAISFGKSFYNLREKTAVLTDFRIKTITEVLSGMLSVKAFCWEQPFISKISGARKDEAKNIRKSQFMSGVNLTLQVAAPALSSMVTFLVCWSSGKELKLSTVLQTVALLQVLRTSVGKKFVRFMEAFPEAHSAVQRLQEFLLLPEIQLPPAPTAADAGAAIVFKNATFTWSALSCGDESADGADGADGAEGADGKKGDSNPTTSGSGDDGGSERSAPPVVAVSDITLSVHPGDLVIVNGAVGAGKTALLQSVLGELELESSSGKFEVAPGAAFVPQTSWIMAGTIRSNILFAAPYDPGYYAQVLTACALDVDIAQLPNGELTEIGDKGVNLSGGQKARISLARAIYARTPVVLLDDPLSAVDPHVARHLFDHAIVGLLRDRATILVTHHEHFQQLGTVALTLGSNGTTLKQERLLEPGELPPRGQPAPAATAENALEAVDESAASPTSPAAPAPEPAGPPRPSKTAKQEAVGKEVVAGPDEPLARLVLPEDRVLGIVRRSTYTNYASAAGSVLSVVVLLLFVGGQGTIIAADYWLQDWAMLNATEQNNVYYPKGYGAIVGAATAAILARSLLFFATTLRASSTLHDNALKQVTYAPMSFFTSNPLGRILNRFSADQGQIDTLLPVCLFDTLQQSSIALGALLVACIAIPWMLIPIPFLTWYFVHVRQFSTASLRELKRLDGTTRSPLQSAFSTDMNGLVLIRSFGKAAAQHDHFLELLEENAGAWYWWLIGNRWLGFLLDVMCTLIVSFAVLLGVAVKNTVDSGILGLSLVYMISLSGLFQYMVRQSALVETYMTSVERMLFYGTQVRMGRSAACATLRLSAAHCKCIVLVPNAIYCTLHHAVPLRTVALQLHFTA